MSFHMPGHKLGRGLPKELLGDLSKLDLTEIPGTDNLFYPKEAINEAQMLAAKAFGADKTYFLVNGSTCGVHAMIMTVCKPDDRLIVARDCHKSVVNGMLLAGVNPIYINPEFDYEFGISVSVSLAQIEDALKNNSNAAGVLITRPNYYGVCRDIEKIAKIVHQYGKVLIVDEAHGSHLAFNGKLPKSAMESGADICVQSAHKTLPAFTQGAYLHVKSEKIDKEKLESNLRMLMTSSPSYILMASLDIARSIMQNSGAEMLDNLISSIDDFNTEIRKTPEIKTLANKLSEQYDKTRLVLNFRECGISGFEAADILRKRFNIQVEMADLYNIICICTVSDGADELKALLMALQTLASEVKGGSGNGKKIDSGIADEIASGIADGFDIKMPALPLQQTNPNVAVRKDKIWIDIETSAGRISADMVVPYPPGIPVICPGEIILDDTISYICSIIKLGGTVNGLKDNSKICVIKG